MTKQLILGLLLFTVSQPALSAENVFDIHVHLWHGEKSIEEYLSQLDRANQDVTGFAGLLMARAGEIDRTRQKNDELIALARGYPKLMAIASVHPHDGAAALEELKRLATLGVKAIKLHPHTQEFDVTDERVRDLCRLAGQLGIVILMDNANIIPGDSENLFNLAVKCPDTDFIFAHLGGLNFRFWNILPAARTAKGFYKENIHFDISGVITLVADSPLEEEFVWTIRNVGVDNVLLASD